MGTRTGMIRAIDGMGRIVIPVELRQSMEMGPSTLIEFFADTDTGNMMMRRYQLQECVFCQSEVQISPYQERWICGSCTLELKSVASPKENESGKRILGSAGTRQRYAVPVVVNPRSARKHGELIRLLREISKGNK
ncbi:AbrB/MazE/SpoVT family DNA-binding domain-containing protein [Paenibacillus massiliensis]|uniref:AbrB/MazE/SpoVT family DNA-binding domain-containing protein n=1 Tax=Paenibacillus massiliensis TaxID=225917 RepID=UPI00036906E2|nr:AbrB/MazE/SpoVT family DNA-binding domain-containing protein [Paenibacillus massiliensis]